ncbi:MAG: DUF1559 domain-containing protein [Planctomycetaceae bacterium]
MTNPLQKSAVVPHHRRGGISARTVVSLILAAAFFVIVLPVAIALILPAIQQARESARRTESKNTMKALGLAIHNYHDTYGMLPPASIATPAYRFDLLSSNSGSAIQEPKVPVKTVAFQQPPRVTGVAPSDAGSFMEFAEAAIASDPSLAVQPFEPFTENSLGAETVAPLDVTESHQHHSSWMTALLPYVGRLDVWNQIDPDQPWDSARNLPASMTAVKEFHLTGLVASRPESIMSGKFGASHYAANAQLLKLNGSVRFHHISDGLSNTILLGTVTTGLAPWAGSGSLRDPGHGIGAATNQFSYPSLPVALFLMGDGSVTVLPSSTSPQVLNALAGPDDGAAIAF